MFGATRRAIGAGIKVKADGRKNGRKNMSRKNGGKSKRWFEDWEIKQTFKQEIILDLPNAFYEGEQIGLKISIKPNMSVKEFNLLYGVLSSAFHQIQLDNGGYRNESKNL